jgi:hypothetical protein
MITRALQNELGRPARAAIVPVLGAILDRCRDLDVDFDVCLQEARQSFADRVNAKHTRRGRDAEKLIEMLGAGPQTIHTLSVLTNKSIAYVHSLVRDDRRFELDLRWYTSTRGQTRPTMLVSNYVVALRPGRS